MEPEHDGSVLEVFEGFVGWNPAMSREEEMALGVVQDYDYIYLKIRDRISHRAVTRYQRKHKLKHHPFYEVLPAGLPESFRRGRMEDVLAYIDGKGSGLRPDFVHKCLKCDRELAEYVLAESRAAAPVNLYSIECAIILAQPTLRDGRCVASPVPEMLRSFSHFYPALVHADFILLYLAVLRQDVEPELFSRMRTRSVELADKEDAAASDLYELLADYAERHYDYAEHVAMAYDLTKTVHVYYHVIAVGEITLNNVATALQRYHTNAKGHIYKLGHVNESVLYIDREVMEDIADFCANEGQHDIHNTAFYVF
ncbi:ORF53 [Ranid herpesvirus 2]|uniref:ORF53 n=1 Tax=Ranid herpesvirus 2 TaxID=389214 RepID=Q14W53_9VIRU|nr:ORF53 [Ranid herpesvirus 2]ABG25643.1 ORF53 [Ranid herpesvirus 2]